MTLSRKEKKVLEDMLTEMLPETERPAAKLMSHFEYEEELMLRTGIIKGAKPSELTKKYKTLCEDYLKNYETMLNLTKIVKIQTKGDKIS